MRVLREWIHRLFGTLHPGRRDSDVEEELRLHLELAARMPVVEATLRRALCGTRGFEQAVFPRAWRQSVISAGCR